MPTLRQLTYLVAVDDERHFGRASARVNVAQPTLSAQISTLEHRLGVTLLERSRSGVSPTPVGQEVIARARRILLEVEDLVGTTRHLSGPLSGRLRLGVPPTLGPYILPHIIPDLHQRFPKLKLHVKEGRPRDIQNKLLSGELDLILTPFPVIHQSLMCRKLFEEELLVATAQEHPLAQATYLKEGQLNGESILTLELGNYLHDQVRELSDRYGGKLLYDFEGTSLDTLRHMVAMNVGISFFPALYVLSEIAERREVSILRLDAPPPTRAIGLAWRKSSTLEDSFHELADLFTQSASIPLAEFTKKLDAQVMDKG